MRPFDIQLEPFDPSKLASYNFKMPDLPKVTEQTEPTYEDKIANAVQNSIAPSTFGQEIFRTSDEAMRGFNKDGMPMFNPYMDMEDAYAKADPFTFGDMVSRIGADLGNNVFHSFKSFGQGTIEAVQSGDITKLWDNEANKKLADLTKELDELHPIYRTIDERDNPLAFRNWDATSKMLIGGGAGTMLASIIDAGILTLGTSMVSGAIGSMSGPVGTGAGAVAGAVAGAASGVNRVRTAFSTVWNLSKAVFNGGKVAQGLKAGEQIADIASKVRMKDALSLLGTGYVFANGEAGLQGELGRRAFIEQAQRDYYSRTGLYMGGEELQEIEDTAIKVGSATYAMNLPLLMASNFMQFPSILMGKHARRMIDDLPITMTAEKGLPKAVKGSTFKFLGKEALVDSIIEGGEEFGQSVIDNLVQTWYDPYKQDQNLLTYSKDILNQTLTQDSVLDFLGGALIGGISGSVGAASNYRRLNKMATDYVEAYNSSSTILQDQMKQLMAIDASIKSIDKESLPKEVLDIYDEKVRQSTFVGARTAAMLGATDARREWMLSHKELPIEEFNKLYDIKATEADRNNYIDQMVEEFDSASQVILDTEKAFATNPFQSDKWFSKKSEEIAKLIGKEDAKTVKEISNKIWSDVKAIVAQNAYFYQDFDKAFIQLKEQAGEYDYLVTHDLKQAVATHKSRLKSFKDAKVDETSYDKFMEDTKDMSITEQYDYITKNLDGAFFTNAVKIAMTRQATLDTANTLTNKKTQKELVEQVGDAIKWLYTQPSETPTETEEPPAEASPELDPAVIAAKLAADEPLTEEEQRFVEENPGMFDGVKKDVPTEDPLDAAEETDVTLEGIEIGTPYTLVRDDAPIGEVEIIKTYTLDGETYVRLDGAERLDLTLTEFNLALNPVDPKKGLYLKGFPTVTTRYKGIKIGDEFEYGSNGVVDAVYTVTRDFDVDPRFDEALIEAVRNAYAAGSTDVLTPEQLDLLNEVSPIDFALPLEEYVDYLNELRGTSLTLQSPDGFSVDLTYGQVEQFLSNTTSLGTFLRPLRKAEPIETDDAFRESVLNLIQEFDPTVTDPDSLYNKYTAQNPSTPRGTVEDLNEFREFLKKEYAPKTNSVPRVTFTDPRFEQVPMVIDRLSWNVIQTNKRAKTLVKIKGVTVPFYLTSGQGGKDLIPGWYPYFGHGPDEGWLNKIDKASMENHYSAYWGDEVADLTRQVSEQLNATYGTDPEAFDYDRDPFAVPDRDGIVRPITSLHDKSLNYINDQLPFTPSDNNLPETRANVIANIQQLGELLRNPPPPPVNALDLILSRESFTREEIPVDDATFNSAVSDLLKMGILRRTGSTYSFATVTQSKRNLKQIGATANIISKLGDIRLTPDGKAYNLLSPSQFSKDENGNTINFRRATSMRKGASDSDTTVYTYRGTFIDEMFRFFIDATLSDTPVSFVQFKQYADQTRAQVIQEATGVVDTTLLEQINDKSILGLFETFNTIQKSAAANDYVFYSTTKGVYGEIDGTYVAGTTDFFLIGPNGEIRIIDLKTSKYNLMTEYRKAEDLISRHGYKSVDKTMLDRKSHPKIAQEVYNNNVKDYYFSHSHQLSVYADLANKLGIPVKSIAVFALQIDENPAGSDIKITKSVKNKTFISLPLQQLSKVKNYTQIEQEIQDILAKSKSYTKEEKTVLPAIILKYINNENIARDLASITRYVDDTFKQIERDFGKLRTKYGDLKSMGTADNVVLVRNQKMYYGNLRGNQFISGNETFTIEPTDRVTQPEPVSYIEPKDVIIKAPYNFPVQARLFSGQYEYIEVFSIYFNVKGEMKEYIADQITKIEENGVTKYVYRLIDKDGTKKDYVTTKLKEQIAMGPAAGYIENRHVLKRLGFSVNELDSYKEFFKLVETNYASLKNLLSSELVEIEC